MAASQEARPSFQKGLNYVLGTPFRTERLSEQDYSFNVSGNPFEDWAGPVSVAFGGEWRLESVNGFVPSRSTSPAGCSAIIWSTGAIIRSAKAISKPWCRC